MKKFKYLYIGVLSAILSGTFTSCEDYLDVNKNPNYPDESQVTVTTLLPSAFTGSAAAMGYLYQLYGSCGHSTTRRIRHPANISRWSTMR